MNGSSKKMYTLFLINPKQREKQFAQQVELSELLGKKGLLTPLALPTVAALTPDNYQIMIIDEELGLIPENILPDIVGITTLAHTIGRVYEIADWYRSKGVTVILGGSYASFMVDECLNHCDTVVIGEAEDIWSQCLADFEQGKLQKSYKAEAFSEFKKSPVPRWDLMDINKIISLGVQISRGCPYNCEFCLINKMQGHRMRYREIDDVIKEIKSLPQKTLFFVDDNLTVDKKYTRELMQRLKPLKVSWTCQASLDVASDEELLKDMAEAGCLYILIGFESINKDCLVEMKKFQNSIEKYETAINKIHNAGIQICGAFIVGFDHDTLEEFDNICDFSIRMKIPFTMINILGIAPGTDIHNRMESEGRLYGGAMDGALGLFSPLYYMNMSTVEMFDKYIETLEKLYSFKTIREKAKNLFGPGKFIYEFDNDSLKGWDKFLIFMRVLKSYLFTRDKDKCLLFKEMTGLTRQKKIAPDKYILFLLSMEGFSRYTRRMRKNRDRMRQLVQSIDRGSWRDYQKNANVTHSKDLY
jgi:radical SAM superfamily enzyme YgiQ (UPF0313 family)